MPADIITTADCASCFGTYEVIGSKGDKYTVTFGGESYAHCTCPAFKYRQDCKHISEVYKGMCGYNIQYNDGKADPKYKPISINSSDIVPGETCPACGGPMVAVRRAV